MLRNRVLSWLPAWIALCALAPTAVAQDTAAPAGYNSGGYLTHGGNNQAQKGFEGAGETEVYNPFVAQPQDNSARYWDDQFFAPVELGGVSKAPTANTGWWFQYDRVFMMFSRPAASRNERSSPTSQEPLLNGIFDTDGDGDGDVLLAFEPPLRGNFSQPGEFDDSWGNRWDFGYMSDEDSGWFGSVYRIEGPAIIDAQKDERLTVVDFAVGDTIVIVDDAGNTIVTVEFPDRGDEDAITNLTQTLNVPGQQRSIISSFWSVELNKNYRARLDNGTFFEPYFGARYVFMRDYYKDLRDYRDTSSQFIQGPDGYGYILAQVFDAYYSTYTEYAKNHMIGPQLGFRWFGTTGRFDLAMDFKAVAAYNRQLMGYRYDPGLSTPLMLSPVEERNLANDEFVPYGQLRLQTAFNLTKYIQLQAGYDLMYFGRGMVRVDTEPQEFDPFPIRDQDMIMSGFTFGFAVNR